MRVMGAVRMFQMRSETQRFKQQMVQHVYTIRGNRFGTDQVNMMVVRLCQAFVSRRSLKQAPLILVLSFSITANKYTGVLAQIVRLGAWMMHAGLGSSTLFHVLEARMDIAFREMRVLYKSKHRALPAPKAFSFRKVVRSILEHPEYFKFLWRFHVRPEEVQIPMYHELRGLWMAVGRSYHEKVLAFLPKCVQNMLYILYFLHKVDGRLSSTPTLTELFDKLHKHLSS
jgi:hypothetical protein